MLEVVEFESGYKRWGLRNSWTGYICPRTYWTRHGAERGADKLSSGLAKTLRKLNTL